MIPKSVLFNWSKGANIRREIIKIIKLCEEKNEPCFLNIIAKKLKLTHVAVKKHTDILSEEGYITPINPEGKPIYLKLSETGKEIYSEFN